MFQFNFLSEFIPFTTPSNLTVSFWFKATDPNGPFQGIFGYGDDGVDGGMWLGISKHLPMAGITTEEGAAIYGLYGSDVDVRRLPALVS